jgi:hypothetical protein
MTVRPEHATIPTHAAHGPRHPGPPPPPGAFGPHGSTGVWQPAGAARPLRCDSCGLVDRGEYCSRCGWSMGSSGSPTRLVAETFLKVGALRRWATLYWTILRAPLPETLRGFRLGRLSDAAKFFEISVGFYFLCLAPSTLFGENPVVGLVGGALFPLLCWGTTYSLYFRWMRRIAPVRRSSRDFLAFLCLTLGFTFPPMALFNVPVVGGVIALLLIVPVYVYLARTWAWFWGTSWVTCAGVLVPCSLAGGLAGSVALLPSLLGL